MTAFFAGVIFGALFAGSIIVIFVTRMKGRKRPEIEPWSETTYQAPLVTTRIVNRHREFEI
jgi:hypothetical protein